MPMPMFPGDLPQEFPGDLPQEYVNLDPKHLQQERERFLDTNTIPYARARGLKPLWFEDKLAQGKNRTDRYPEGSKYPGSLLRHIDAYPYRLPEDFGPGAGPPPEDFGPSPLIQALQRGPQQAPPQVQPEPRIEMPQVSPEPRIEMPQVSPEPRIEMPQVRPKPQPSDPGPRISLRPIPDPSRPTPGELRMIAQQKALADADERRAAEAINGNGAFVRAMERMPSAGRGWDGAGEDSLMDKVNMARADQALRGDPRSDQKTDALWSLGGRKYPTQPTDAMGALAQYVAERKRGDQKEFDPRARQAEMLRKGKYATKDRIEAGGRVVREPATLSDGKTQAVPSRTRLGGIALVGKDPGYDDEYRAEKAAQRVTNRETHKQERRQSAIENTQRRALSTNPKRAAAAQVLLDKLQSGPGAGSQDPLVAFKKRLDMIPNLDPKVANAMMLQFVNHTLQQEGDLALIAAKKDVAPAAGAAGPEKPGAKPAEKPKAKEEPVAKAETPEERFQQRQAKVKKTEEQNTDEKRRAAMYRAIPPRPSRTVR